MASSSSVLIPELTFLSPQSTPRRCISLSRNTHSRLSLSRNRGGCDFRLRTLIRAVKEDGVVVEERESELIEGGNGVGLSSNGAATTSTSGNGYVYNGSLKKYSNGGVSVLESGNGASNGSLMKYVNGNGVAAEVEDAEVKEEGRKKRVEEIGKEDAWFKQSGDQKVEVEFLFLFFSMLFEFLHIKQNYDLGCSRNLILLWFYEY